MTPTQQEITDLYFNLDLTLSEIAEQKGITRQGVSECLKTCKKQLEEYEEKKCAHTPPNLRPISFFRTPLGCRLSLMSLPIADCPTAAPPLRHSPFVKLTGIGKSCRTGNFKKS